MTLPVATVQQQAPAAPAPPAPAPVAYPRGIDTSNFTGVLTAADAEAFAQSGIVWACVEAVAPPPGYPTGETAEQLAALQAVGILTDVYVYLWSSDTHLTRFARDLATAAGCGVIGRIWVDWEDVSKGYSPKQRLAQMQAALVFADASGISQTASGVYTGKWYVDAGYVPSDLSSLAARRLWVADYDGIPDPTVWQPFGPWANPTIKQYRGTSTLDGVSNLDRDVLAPEA